MDGQDKIIIKGAREHNLKNIDLEIPKNKLVVFTGISGSGKSSLAFDTIYAEGQRRYVESLSSYARQFLGVMDKPDVDYISGLSPAICIDQKGISHNPRSTVGTVTEIYDYLRLLYARIGHPHCPQCNREISQQGVQQMVDQTLQMIKVMLGTSKIVKFMILSPVIRSRKGEFTQLFQSLLQKGYSKVRIDNQVFNLSDDLVLIKTNKHDVDVVIDRLSVDLKNYRDEALLNSLKTRLNDAFEQALKISEGLVYVTQVLDPEFDFPDKPKIMEDHIFSQKFACPVCNISIGEIEPRSFSFNSPFGACPVCSGLGSLLKVDADLIMNPRLSITEGGILPFSSMFEHDTWFSRIIKTVSLENGIDPAKPISLITAAQKKLLLNGTGDVIYEIEGDNRYGRKTKIYEPFRGLVFELEKRYQETESEYVRQEIVKYMRQEVCPSCQGQRLKKEVLSVTIQDFSIADITHQSISKVKAWITDLENGSILNAKEKEISSAILKEIKLRLTFLESVGLDYLTLDRGANTLAGGENQRIRLASQIGSGLTGVLYVLDEPSIGLHQKDNEKLIKTLKNLRDLGNTVVVVEHDRDMMLESDYIFDFGPGAGEHGGQITAKGTPEEIMTNPDSLTGLYLSGKKEINYYRPEVLLTEKRKYLKVLGCRQFNLKNIDLVIPLGSLVCLTGVSGSGKSTLLNETLYHALMAKLNPYHREKPGTFKTLEGDDFIDKVIMIDQSPIGRTPRSNPATYTGIFSYIRDLFSQLPEAKIRGFKPGRFSFNVEGGRCEACQGEGQVKIEMQFLPDIYVDCEVCHGKRYNNETLEVTYKNKNIAEILDLTVEEALDLFRNIPGLVDRLETLKEVGLSYVRLGQPAPTLSGGEAQRVKIATELAKKATGRTLYLLDEPTTGLHFADLEKLLTVLRKLVDKGNTIVVIEHNLDVIKNADWIIDLGPEGGDKGGYIVAEGSPRDIANAKNSYTGQFLKRIL
jgi:excinuclease ABC subunit A